MLSFCCTIPVDSTVEEIEKQMFAIHMYFLQGYRIVCFLIREPEILSSYFHQTIPWVDEVSIGHALICDALYLGLRETIGLYLKCLE